ncbi:hypothetical protein [Dyella caseinilytica]|uniref:Uncharacterized protein n=1 Tax=Dyella caseinilytica TaxID=1849581 RepID=A0ABX7GSF8_9GAMM|nr:hypothetical protein [Dyella caseinilytica]QRN52978.1 hypothetical protein ISN74_16255 [Dyella caseinilytica]GGA10398.1 hypothetical protein GCM10011408_34720 [Dyella caseinilytica]
MKRFSGWCFIVAGLLCVTPTLAGVWDHTIAIPDIATATVQGRGISSRLLTPQQLTKLVDWFKAHDKGWEGLMETPPAPIAMEIATSGPNGQQSSLDLFVSNDGTATAYFYAPKPAFPLKRHLSEADVKGLQAAIGN